MMCIGMANILGLGYLNRRYCVELFTHLVKNGMHVESQELDDVVRNRCFNHLWWGPPVV